MLSIEHNYFYAFSELNLEHLLADLTVGRQKERWGHLFDSRLTKHKQFR